MSPEPHSETPEKFYLTTPIYYVNARPHIGHAYSTIVADVLARRHRLLGHDTLFLTGTDEHGQKIERSAAAAGIPPQEFADQVSQTFRTLWDRMGLTYSKDRYIRTTDPHHKAGVQHLFTTLYDRGHIYLSTYTGQYSIGEEMFVDGPPGTIGPDGRPTETVTEENFFFRLSNFQQPLLDLIESNTLKITPESSKNEVLSFIRSGLKDLSISRSSFTWGIPVPAEIQHKAGATQPHIVYVWLDALANYMTAIGYGDPGPAAQADFARFWPADLHLVGKEITRFHCVFWPAFLLAADLPLPKAITANGWLLFDNSKMSKSKGNVVRTETILDAFGPLCPPVRREPSAEAEDAPLTGTASAVPPTDSKPAASAAEVRPPTKAEQDLFAADILRYYLLREIPFGQDGSFSFDSMITRYNADLTNGYGNLVSRTLNLIQQNFAAQVPPRPEPPWRCTETGKGLTAWEKMQQPIRPDDAFLGTGDLIETMMNLCASSAEVAKLNTFDLSGIMLRVVFLDRYISFHAPWTLAKSPDPEDRKKLTEVLYTAAESIRILTALLYPYLPAATAKVWHQLGLGSIEAAATQGNLKHLQWGGLEPGTQLGPLSPIFPRADKSLAAQMEDMEAATAKPTEKAPPMPTPDTSHQPAAPNTHPAAPLKSAQPDPRTTPPPAGPWTLDPEPSTTDPAAPPRTSSLETPNPGAQVAASNAITTEREGTPPHTEAQASGIFAAASLQLTTGNRQPATERKPPFPPDTPEITIDDFTKIDLRVARILVAERIPKADKLLRLEVDLGYEQRQILSGIAEHYTPEELIGRKIVIIANLAPRKMRGLESRGMLLAASEGENGKPILATFAEDIALGTRLR